MKWKIDAHSPQGKELQNVVKEKLKEYLGEYNDDVLPLYIVVMLQHGNNEALITENLEAFLGKPHSASFASWLFQLLEREGSRFQASGEGTAPESARAIPESAEAPPQSQAERRTDAAEARSPSGEKRRGKIQWRPETVSAPAGAGSGEERAKSDRERKRERDRQKEAVGQDHHHRDREGRDRRRREARDSRDLDAREARHSSGRHEERERRMGREKGIREQGRERVPRARDTDHEQDHQWNSHVRGPGGEHPRARHAPPGLDMPRERDDWYHEREHNVQHQRRGSPARADVRVKPRVGEGVEARPRGQLAEDVERRPVSNLAEDVDMSDADTSKRRVDAEAGMPAVAMTLGVGSAKRGLAAGGLRSSAIEVRRPPESARPSVLSRLDKRPAPLDESDDELQAPAKRVAGQGSVFDRLRGVKAPVARPVPMSNGQSLEGASSLPTPSAPASRTAAPSILARVSLVPSDAANGLSQTQLNANAAPFVPSQTQLNAYAAPYVRSQKAAGAVPASAPSASGLAPTPATSGEDDLKAQVEAMRAQIEELKRQSAVASAAIDVRSVVVSMLDPRATQEIIRAHFAGAGIPPLGIEVLTDGFGNPIGVAHVELATQLAAQTALALSGSRLLGNPITVLPKTGQQTPLVGSGLVYPPIRPMLPAVSTFGRGRSRGSFPSPMHPARGPFAGRAGRGRVIPLTSNTWIRPELKEELAKKQEQERTDARAKLDRELDALHALKGGSDIHVHFP